MKKRLRNLLRNLKDFKKYGREVYISGITDDSRLVKKGNLFVAIVGKKHDAHENIDEVIEKGASAVVGVISPQGRWLEGTTYIKVGSSRKFLSYLAAAWYGYPAKRLKIIGVTGTDGKTTTANIIYWLLKKSGKKVGLISTVNARIGNKRYDTGLHVTNPEPLLLQKFLAKMVDAGCRYAVLEVTSHGLDQERVAGIDFDIGVLTNITHEHLDYHKTWLDYFNAKAKLFEYVKIAVLNKDDTVVFEDMKCVTPSHSDVITYGIKENSAEYFGRNIETDESGLEFDVVYRRNSHHFKLRLLGDYNVSNFLAAVAVARVLGISWETIKKAAPTFRPPVGRLEEIKNNKGVKIYVDFAHTPNALENVLSLLAERENGRLIAIFGCAGERDFQKRSLMPTVSARLADISVFTAEDPRSENVDDILEIMARSAKVANAVEVKYSKNNKPNRETFKKHVFLRIPDRGEAISFAVRGLAKKGDVVVVCGKGHEKSMAYGNVEYPWSDQSAVKEALAGGVFRIKR